ncbi:MAG: sodium:calcium antiporter [Kineosporiaceae bacterium]
MLAFLLACLVGLILLARASDALVSGSSALAARLGVPTLVVGVVIIGFGTSSPELLVSGLAAAGNSPAIGVGTVIGSNIANLSLVLGVGALVAPLAVRAAVVRREAPLSLLATVVFAVAVRDGLTRPWGLVLLVLLGVSLGLLVRWALADRAEAGNGSRALREEVTGVIETGETRRMAVVVGQALGGLVGTMVGAQVLVWGAVGVAREASLPEGFIGATIVAIGTSLPELVTAAQAARRGDLLGSNLFNALAVGGLIAVVGGGAAVGGGLRGVGVFVMLAVSALALLFMGRDFKVVRWEAAALLVVYLVTLPLLSLG